VAIGSCHLASDHLHRLEEAVAGAKRVGQEGNRIAELADQRLLALLGLHRENQHRDAKPDEGEDEAEQQAERRRNGRQDDEAEGDAADRRGVPQRDVLADREPDIRPHEEGGGPLRHRPPLHHPLHELLRGLPLAAPDDEEEQADDRKQHT